MDKGVRKKKKRAIWRERGKERGGIGVKQGRRVIRRSGWIMELPPAQIAFGAESSLRLDGNGRLSSSLRGHRDTVFHCYIPSSNKAAFPHPCFLIQIYVHIYNVYMYKCLYIRIIWNYWYQIIRLHFRIIDFVLSHPNSLRRLGSILFFSTVSYSEYRLQFNKT